MNNIDINRLKRDRAYWDEVAPKWATALSFVGDSGLRVWHNLKSYQYAKGQGGFQSDEVFDFSDGGACTYRLYETVDSIPRPATEPEPATEWDGEGLPPVGAKVEYYSKCSSAWLGPLTVFHVSKSDRIFAEYDKGIGDYETSPDLNLFRPFYPKAERDRADLESAIVKTLRQCHYSESDETVAHRLATVLSEEGFNLSRD